MKKRKKKKPAKKRQRSSASEYLVFVSHATTDKWIATVICEKLEDVGAKTFRDDRDIKGGDDIPDEIRRAIKRSKEVLILLTPESVGRQWVQLEAGAAWALRRRIVVVQYHVQIAAVPDMLKAKKAISLNDFDHYLAEVRQRAGS